MKFKDYINEKYINKSKEYAFLLLGRMPIAPKLWSRIQKITKIDNTYHVTSPDNIKNMYKMQGTKKQISTFTRADITVVAGIETEGGVLFELSGESTLSIDGDAWTSLDRNGMRWWDLDEMGSGEMPEFDTLFHKLSDINIDVLKKDKEFKEFFQNNELTAGPLQPVIDIMEANFSGKQKARFIKEGLDAVEKHLKKVDIMKMVTDANTTLKGMFGNQVYFNEIVLHNIKIKKIYGVVPYSTNKQIKIREQLLDGTFEYKYDGWVTETEVEDIDKTRPRILSAEVAFGI